MSGLGAVTAPPSSGSPAPAGTLISTVTQPTVTVGGVPATVLFSGLAPNFVALYQVNVRMPLNAPTGDAIPVVISMGAAASNTVTIGVQ